MTGQKRIQIVEDEAVIAMEMALRLQGFGFEVVGTAVSCEEALQMAERSRPDLIMMDVQIKGSVDGIETARRIREFLDVPVLFLTAYGDEATLGRAMETAPYGYLIKPYRPDELRATIKVVLKKHETETRLRQSERWLARTLECLDEGIIATGTDGRVRLMNPEAERLTSQLGQQALGRDIEEVFTLLEPASDLVCPNPLRRALDSGEPVSARAGELPLMHGERRTHVEVSAAPIRDRDGTPLGGVLVFRDTTVQKIAEEQLHMYEAYLETMVRDRTAELEQANAVKSSFLSAMSHELRTPMNAVLGFSQLLEMETLTEQQAGFVQHIHQAGVLLLRLISDLLDLKGIETGQLEVSSHPVAVADVLAQAEVLVRPLCARKNVSLRLPETVSSWVTADPLRLQQVLLKLLSNAINFNRMDGLVDVAVAEVSGTHVRISVRDTGSGVDPTLQARLFQPFERLRQLNVGLEGTGNGLALSKRLVELMHGEIGFKTTPGVGSVFWFTLPIAAAGAH